MKHVIVCLIGLLISVEISAHNLEEVIAKTLPSVVYIEVDRIRIATRVDPLTSTITEFRTKAPPVIGTGFVIEDNKIVTNYHVIQPAFEHSTPIHVSFYNSNGRRYLATIIGYDDIADVALLQIEGKHPSLTISPNTASLRMGAEVFSISNFFSMRHSTTVGIVSSNNRIDSRFPYIRLLQLQMLQGSGSSGGPVLDVNGQVVSLNHSIMSMIPEAMLNTPNPSLMSVLAYTIRGDQLLQSVERIKREGVINRVDLGVRLEPYGATSERFLYNPVPDSNNITGVLVVGDYTNTSRDLLPNDIILNVDRRAFTDAAEFLLWLDDRYNPGDKIKIQVYRDGSVINIETTLDLAQRLEG